MHKRFLVVFILGFSSGLPLALITGTLQAWFADAGMSVMATGMLSLLSIPYVYRVAWGCILDRHALFPIGKRRSWILTMQVLLLLGFNALAWLSPKTSPNLMAALAFLLACFSATQDVAIDAQRVEYLPLEKHALGASFAVFGYRVALLTGGGLALIIAQYAGWAVAYRTIGSLMFIGILTTLWSQEPVTSTAPDRMSLLNSFVIPFKEFALRPGVIFLLLFIFFYKLGEAFTATTSGIVMPFLIQGIGFSLDTVAYINKLLGISAILLGGFVAGFLLMRWSLYRALLVFGILQAMTNLLFVALAMVGKNIPLLAVSVVCDNFVTGMGSTALVALFMRLVNQHFTGTQFSILVAFSTLPRILSGPLAAFLQSIWGWVGLYELSVLLALGFIPFLFVIRHQIYPVTTNIDIVSEQSVT